MCQAPRQAPLQLEKLPAPSDAAAERQKMNFTLFIVGAYIALNLGLNFFNKYALGRHTDLHFTYPLFYTACHQVTSFIFSSSIMYLNPSMNTLSLTKQWKHKWMILLLGICFVLNIACNNASLMYIALSINGVIKSITPLPTMILSYVVERKRYAQPVVLSVLGMVVCAIASIPYGDDDNASAFGLFLATVSMLAVATRPVMTVVLQTNPAETGLTPMVLVWYDSLISMVLLITVSLATELDGLRDYFAQWPWRAVGIAALGSSMAFCYNIVMFYLPKLLGSLTTSVLGNARQVVVIGLSAFFIDHLTRANSVIGITLFSLCCGWYTFYVVQEKRQANADKAASERMQEAAPVVDAKPAGASPSKAGENTPLIVGGSSSGASKA